VDQPTHELEKWKIEASTHKHAAHELAKAAKVAKQEALDARNRLDEERESAQRNREDANEVIDSLQKQMQAMNSSPSKVVSSSAEVGTLLAQVNDANYKHHNLMQEIKYKDDEISEVRRKAVYNTPNANSLDRTKGKMYDIFAKPWALNTSWLTFDHNSKCALATFKCATLGTFKL